MTSVLFMLLGQLFTWYANEFKGHIKSRNEFKQRLSTELSLNAKKIAIKCSFQMLPVEHSG